MDAAQLRATQAPIKERYKSDPKAAMITLTAKGSIESEGIACKVETGRALAVAGVPTPTARPPLGLWLESRMPEAAAPPAPRGLEQRAATTRRPRSPLA